MIECYGISQFSKTADGTRASCLCPFHDDHNPSLKIDGNRGIFKCFSCGVGGNALSFVREYAKLHGSELSFLEAVKLPDDMMVTGDSSYGNSVRRKASPPSGHYRAPRSSTSCQKRDGIKNWWYHPKEVTIGNLFFQQSSSDYPTARFTRQFTCGSLLRGVLAEPLGCRGGKVSPSR